MIAEVKTQINKCNFLCKKAMGNEKYKFKQEINKIKKNSITNKNFKKTKQNLNQLKAKIQASIAKREWKKNNLPQPVYNKELPIVSKKNEIIQAIAKNRVVIISGETGSGKTTQIPKFCLEAGQGIDGKIGCTQPRRIAAITVARRIAEELGEDLGKSVGYKIRFQDQTSDNSFIKIMTDGILLAETQGDSWLNEYDTIIVDEAHERSLNIDFVLGILKTLIKKRRNLKLIITSATIDTEKFSKAFDNAPIIEVSGRMFPVDVRYMESEYNEDQTHVDMAVKAVHKLHQESPYGGDILVFMPTEQDIRETCEILEGRQYTGVNILPLFARLSAGDQSRVFASMTGRKIIVATNVAETSITIPGIKYVVDTGLARISQYSPGSGTTALPVTAISKSSADQRMGRCGRVENGICIRLFSQKDYENRPKFTLPEILRSNLAEVILRMISLNLGDVKNFPFIDPPGDKNIYAGFQLLKELGAICKNRKNNKKPFILTNKGKMMAKMPVDPKISRILLEAGTLGCLKEITIIASALTIQDPRERPLEKQTQADQAHGHFKDPCSDFITLLNIWNKYHNAKKELKSITQMRKYCKTNFLAFKRMREWRDIHHQISLILEEYGLKDNQIDNQEISSQQIVSKKDVFGSKYTAIHKAILSGFLSNIAMQKEKFFYKAAKDKEVMIFPGSGLFNKSGPWIVAAELVETSRLFARIVANIDVKWLESIGKDQCKYSYQNPHWEKNRGQVTASEQVSLYGLIIEPGRQVSFGRINPEHARKIFISSALVEGDVKQNFSFMKHNFKLINEIKNMEDKIRRRDILISHENLCEFYEKRLGNNIYDIRTLKQFLKNRKNDYLLRMNKEDLLMNLPDESEINLYPDEISLGNTVVPCDYNFDPGKSDDGLTVKISSALAPSILPEATDWMVPGLFKEKITALVKGLPKEYRKQLVPVSNTVDIIADKMAHEPDTPLITALSRFIYNNFNVDIPASAWNIDELPEHLKMRIAILGPKGEEIKSGRNPLILSTAISAKVNQDNFANARKKWERTDIKVWDFPDLPETITLRGNKGEKWTAYPGLKPDENTISLKLFQDRHKSIKSHKKGIGRLFILHFPQEIRMLKSHIKLPKDVVQYAAYFGDAKLVEKRLFDSIIDSLFYKNIRTENEFNKHAQKNSSIILEKGKTKLKHMAKAMQAYHECRLTIFELENSNKQNKSIIEFLSMLRDSLSKLMPENFPKLYDENQMEYVKRYIRAITMRSQRGVVNFEKDQTKAKQIKIHTDQLNILLKSLSPNVSEEKRKTVEEFFWLIEEFKVSLFAQELKTPIKISSKRLDKKFKEIQRMV